MVEGFKHTDFGSIPNDWDDAQIGDVCEKVQDGNYGGSYPKSHEFIKIGIPFLTSKAIGKDGVLKIHLVDFISERKHDELKKAHLKLHDVLFTNRGASVGAIGFVDERISNGNIGPQLTLLRASDEKLVPQFLLQAMKSNFVQKQIIGQDAGSAMNFFGVGSTKKFKIPLPPTKAEQTAIATALNDADALIQKLEQLIAKKRNIKTGAMQELLKPKEGWKESILASECDLITKGTTPTSVGREFQNSGINFIKIESLTELGEIIKEKVAFIDNYTHNLLKRSQLKSGDALFSIAGALGRVALVSEDLLPANTNQALAIIRLKKDSEINLRYLFYFLNSRKIQNHILAINVQGAQANLSLVNIAEFIIEHPDKSEQNNIAKILSDMDKEIQELERQLEKYKMMKQGMMQSLLTGKIRLA